MREALNNNPMAQLAVVAVLVLAAGVMLAPQLMGHKGGSGATTTTTSAQLTAPTGTVDLTVKSSGTAPSSGSVPGSPAAPPPAQTVSPQALIPGPGLPRPVISAWHRGDTVVLLVVRPAGIDDRLVRDSVHSLSDSRTAVFVVRADKIARYSRITQGVGVTQVPALVVVRPRRLSGAVPEAEVVYGFRDSQGVVQAVHDAVYSGKENLPYSPR